MYDDAIAYMRQNATAVVESRVSTASGCPIFLSRHYKMSGTFGVELPNPWDFPPLLDELAEELYIQRTANYLWNGEVFRYLYFGVGQTPEHPRLFLLLARMVGVRDLLVEIEEVDPTDQRIPPARDPFGKFVTMEDVNPDA